ncbi:M949_RS01915 family surface polysaccharide biosynthesis protein [Emticicia sp. 17c]|uniref:M949_RS01915 family surface polysaccharide biosynthesis protein n=1 Tax=Emticicia sp. 17c TaxID=3127704 RepID=UPI00301E4AF2
MKDSLTIFLIQLVFVFTVSGQKTIIKNIPEETMKQFNTFGTTVLKSVQFADKNGTNYLLITMEEASKDDYHSKTLLVQHFKDGPNKQPILIRQIIDFERDCPVDNQLNLLENSLTIGDLDKNGYNEIIFLYTTGCKGDVSPSGLKLMVLENGNKAAIRGKTVIKGFNFPQDKDMDSAFRKLPAIVQNKAQSLWSKFEQEY